MKPIQRYVKMSYFPQWKDFVIIIFYPKHYIPSAQKNIKIKFVKKVMLGFL